MSAQFRPNPSRNLGAKATATALSFQDALLKAFDTVPWSQLTMVHVARLAGMSPASAYQYYATLDALLLATADRLKADNEPLPKHMELVLDLLQYEASLGL